MLKRLKDILHEKKEYLFTNWKEDIIITDDVRQKNASRVFTGGVRINNGMYRTDEETARYIAESLKRHLP